MSTLKFARRERNQCRRRSLQGGEMLDRDEHAKAMSQVIEKVYSLDLFSPPV